MTISDQHILAIEQGTTSSRAMVFNSAGADVAAAQQEFPQIYPHGGWVEHDPEAIWTSTLDVIHGTQLSGFQSSTIICS